MSPMESSECGMLKHGLLCINSLCDLIFYGHFQVVFIVISNAYVINYIFVVSINKPSFVLTTCSIVEMLRMTIGHNKMYFHFMMDVSMIFKFNHYQVASCFVFFPLKNVRIFVTTLTWARDQGKNLQRCAPKVKPRSHIPCFRKCRRGPKP
jgi:hypothetical protein